MLKILKLLPSHSCFCFELIDSQSGDKNYFKKLGWSYNQFNFQLLKKNSFGLGLFKKGVLIGFVIGDLIAIEKILEYEIFILYVSIGHRKLGYASRLLNSILLHLKKKKLKKIYLEVGANNISAINLYKKNEYKHKAIRNKYYKIEDKSIDAYFFEKIINE